MSDLKDTTSGKKQFSVKIKFTHEVTGIALIKADDETEAANKIESLIKECKQEELKIGGIAWADEPVENYTLDSLFEYAKQSS